jgi:hypothetical protein
VSATISQCFNAAACYRSFSTFCGTDLLSSSSALTFCEPACGEASGSRAFAKARTGNPPRCAGCCLRLICRKYCKEWQKKYRVDRQRLVAPGERGLQAKNVGMWMVWESGSKSLRQIGELFGGLDYAAVAQRIRRTKSTYNPIAAQRLIITMLNLLGRVAES